MSETGLFSFRGMCKKSLVFIYHTEYLMVIVIIIIITLVRNLTVYSPRMKMERL